MIPYPIAASYFVRGPMYPESVPCSQVWQRGQQARRDAGRVGAPERHALPRFTRPARSVTLRRLAG